MKNRISNNWHLRSYTIEPWAYTENLFTQEECEKIIAYGTNQLDTIEEARVGGNVADGIGRIDNTVRKNRICFFNSLDSEIDWVFRKLTDNVLQVNNSFWNFDLTYIESLQFTIYDETDDFYKPHIDMSFTGFSPRKMSFSLQLSNPDDYKGCDLEITDGTDGFLPTKREQGTCISFPSFLSHRVTSLTEGKRYSLVGWVVGPQFK